MRELNPKLWDGLRLKPEVRLTLLKNALAFKKFMDAPGLKIDDVLLVGSSASRWWTKHSDIDLHLVVDFEQSVCPKWADGFFSAQKSLWNQTHDVSVFGHEVELYVEDLAKPANSAGAYSLTLDRWLREPTAGEMLEDDPSVVAKADALENEINDLLAGDPSKETVEELIERLKRLRRDGLAADGEKSTENWAYKVLRSRKALYKLWAARKSLADDELSLNERIAPRVLELWDPPLTEAAKKKKNVKNYYHVTSLDNVEAIMRDGLKPGYGPRSQAAAESVPAIYLFPTRVAAEDATMNWLGDEMEDDETMALIRVTLPTKWDLKSEVPYEVYSTEPIPPKFLKVLTRNF